MNRLDIIREVAKILTTKGEAAETVMRVFDTISEALKNGEKVVISNFGTFRPKSRQPRNGRNPKTGVAVSIPARRSIRFKASKTLLEP